jgi:hypothetical protein
MITIEDKQTYIRLGKSNSRAIIVGEDDGEVSMNVFFAGGSVRTCMTHEETEALIAALQLAMTA